MIEMSVVYLPVWVGALMDRNVFSQQIWNHMFFSVSSLRETCRKTTPNGHQEQLNLEKQEINFWWCRFDVVFMQVWCRLLTERSVSETCKNPQETCIKVTLPTIVFLTSFRLFKFLVMSFWCGFHVGFLQDSSMFFSVSSLRETCRKRARKRHQSSSI